MRITRRAFIKRTLQATAAAGVVYPTIVEPWRVDVEKVTIAVRGLPDAFVGYKVVQLSDLHYMPYTTLRQIAHVVELTNALQPDLVAITGDFMTRESGVIEKLVPILTKIQARHGITSCLGNHDMGPATWKITTCLRRSGIEVLRNQGRELTHQGASIYLAGVESICNGNPDLKAALSKRPPGLATILLVHEPDFIDMVPISAEIGLQLSGHTHGGQVCLPFIGAVILPDWGKKYWRGLRKVGETMLYTNRGIGTIGLPARWGSIPEITEITLAAS